MKVEPVEVKDETFNDNEVDAARDRLKGALQVLVHNDEDETNSSDEDAPSQYRPPKITVESPMRIKTKKRRVDNLTGNSFHHTYVMKLFDRSVDLAQFEEDTPLYPICRAWMANQPRNPIPIVKRRLSSPEPESRTNGDGENELGDIHRLPPPALELINRIPSPTPEQLEKEDKDEILDTKLSLNREELLQLHGARWSNVRRKWQKQAKKYEDRYSESTTILTAIYNKAQENMA